jgi:hypothetical protein
VAGAAHYHGCRIGVREKGSDLPTRRPFLLADRMRPQDAERIPMIAIDYRFNFFASHENL